jgi:phenylpropionate dioxygenase-like ring-hydroxylating dioxygenase large terminal subunit
MSLPIDPHLIETFWHCIGHRSELPNDRDYMRFEWMLGDIIIYNDKGTILAFDNVCPHRGAKFLTDDDGNAPISCRYHGWGYRGGKLRIPKPETYNVCALAKAHLSTFHTAWCGDFLFIASNPQMDLLTQLGDLADVLAGMSADIERRYSRDGYFYDCPWRVAVENALEPDHVPFVHAQTLASLQLGAGRNNYYAANSVLSAPIGNEHITRGLNRIARFFDVRHNIKNYTAIFIFPFSFISSTFGYTYSLQNFFPSRDTNRTHFTTRMFRSKLRDPEKNEAVIGSFLSSIDAINRQVFQEDYEICKRISPDFPMDATDNILSATEEKILHFRKNIEQETKKLSLS